MKNEHQKASKTNMKSFFTFTDSLIVIAVLSIIYIIAAADIMKLQNEARTAKAYGDLKALQLAIESFKADHDICPMEQDYERVLTGEFSNILPGNLSDPFAASVNKRYNYRTSKNMQIYVVFSVGSKGKGSAAISNDGRILLNGSPIFVSNGYL